MNMPRTAGNWLLFGGHGITLSDRLRAGKVWVFLSKKHHKKLLLDMLPLKLTDEIIIHLLTKGESFCPGIDLL